MPPKKLFLASMVLFVLITFPFINLVGASLEMWSQTYGGEYGDITYSFDFAYSLVETSDGGYALAGYTTSFVAGDRDFWLVKTDEHEIIPEFPSWTILPLFLTVTLVVAIYRRKLSKTSNPAFILGD